MLEYAINENEGKGNKDKQSYITKSMPPNSFTHVSTALSKLFMFLTSTPPIPMTFDPGRAVEMDLAMDSVLDGLRPIIHALAPR